MRIYTSFGAVYSLIQRGIIKKSSEIGPTLEAAGLHGLEFNPCILEISPRYAPGFSFSPAELKDIPLSLHSNYVDFNLGSLNPFIRKAAIEQLKAEIRLAGEWNIPVLTIHPGWVRKIKRELAMEFFWDSLATFLENLEPTAPIICLENMDHRPHKLCNTAEEISKTLERFPALKLTVDFAHLGLTGEDITSFLDRFQHRIEHIHISGVIPGKPHSEVSLDASRIDFRPFIRRFLDRDIITVIENRPWEIMMASKRALENLQ